MNFGPVQVPNKATNELLCERNPEITQKVHESDGDQHLKTNPFNAGSNE